MGRGRTERGAATGEAGAGSGAHGADGADGADRVRGADGSPGPDGARPAGARLKRSRGSKVVAGVCGGLGRHYDVDPVVVRVPVAVLSIVGGLGLLLYGFAWLLLPLEGEDENEGRRLLTGRVAGSTLAALLCALGGSGLMLAAMSSGARSLPFSVLLSAALVGALVWSRNRRREEAEARPDPLPHTPPEAQAPPVPHAPSWWRDPLAKDAEGGSGDRDSGYLWGPADADASTDGIADRPADPFAAPGGTGTTGTGTSDADAASGAGRRRRRLGWIVVPAALVVGVNATAVAWDSGQLGTALVTGCAWALGVLVLGLLASVFFGRVGVGTVLATALTGALLVGAALLPDDITTTWSSTRWAPASADEVRSVYRTGNGEAALDLSGVGLTEGQSVRSAVDTGVGELRVIVPQNVTLRLDLDVAIGGYRLREGAASEGGVAISRSVTVEPRGDAEPAGAVHLDVDMVVGELVVEQAIVEPAR
ncbi:PspC domain-containing protein [Streptomyces sp. JJ66]|nr:PspC domain-containing protein [Streptomyces sp. JJ66]